MKESEARIGTKIRFQCEYGMIEGIIVGIQRFSLSIDVTETTQNYSGFRGTRSIRFSKDLLKDTRIISGGKVRLFD